MSRYKQIKTEYRNLESLKKALTDLKVPYTIGQIPQKPDLPLHDYMSDLRPERASIVIQHDWLDRNWSGTENHRGFSNDIGFAWDGKEYVGIVSEYDQGNNLVQNAMNKLRQRYGFHEVQRLAHAKGYTVRDTATDGSGAIRITLSRR